ncbi:hypothetical protein [Escherichia coli]|uniref:hypothetical protein n=1 Tax=Escherichia coli TaxID=562 RepID=UPI0025428A8A|nr:hypothetical protein [Escherichia coli]
MLYWKRMPSLWIGIKISEFNDLDTAKAIAALKIYLTFCLFCKESDSGQRTVELTFSNLCEIASLSRSLVNEGLKILYAKELIKNLSTTVRKKIYTVDVLEKHDDGWCKLPFKGIVGEDGKISAFQSMHNRYPFELLALQTYMYLLYARDNRNEYTLARKKTICKKLKCTKGNQRCLIFQRRTCLFDCFSKSKLEYFILILDESKKIGPKPLDFGPSIP